MKRYRVGKIYIVEAENEENARRLFRERQFSEMISHILSNNFTEDIIIEEIKENKI